MALLNFPAVSGGYTPPVLAHCFNLIRVAFLGVVTRDEAVDGILLRSPGGKVFRLSVSDAGALTATPV